MATGHAVDQTTFLKVDDRVYSKLAAAITAGATSLTVTLADAGLFPDTYPYVLTIEDERVLVTNRSSNTLTVTRAYDGTTAAAHSNNTHIALNIISRHVSDLNAAVNTIEQALQDGLQYLKVYGAADYLLDIQGGTVNSGGAEIRLTNYATIKNTTSGVLELATDNINLTASARITLTAPLGITLPASILNSLTINGSLTVTGSLTYPYSFLTGTADHPIDMSGATANTADILMTNNARLRNTTAGQVDILPSGTTYYVKLAIPNNVPTLYGKGAYLRIGDVQATQHSLAAEDDLMITGKLEVTGTTYLDGFLDITPSAASAYPLRISGTAILQSGEQAIYINVPSETTATNAIWITLKSTVTSGDLTGVRSRVYGNADSAGANVRGGYFEAKMAASGKYAANLEGILSHADYSAGSITVSGYVSGFTVQISEGASLTTANLYGLRINIQTRGDETIATDDVGLIIRNEAHGGNGRQMDAAILIADAYMSGGVKAFGYGIDLNGANIATADIRLQNGETIDNLIDGRVEISGSIVVPIIYGDASTYLRIGDAGTTSHSLASEDDLMVTGKIEVDGVAYFDGGGTLGGTLNVNGQILSNVSNSIGAGTNNTLKLYGVGSAAGDGAIIFIESNGAGGALEFYTGNAAGDTSTQRLSISKADTAVATWSSITHTGFVLGGELATGGNYFNAGSGNAGIETTGAGQGLFIRSTQDGQSGANLQFIHVSTTPAQNDYQGFMFYGYNTNTPQDIIQYGFFYCSLSNVGAGTEAANFVIQLYDAGAANTAMILTGAGGLTVDADVGTGDDPVGLFDNYDDAIVLRQGIQQRNWDLLVSMGVFSRKDTGCGYMMNIQPMTRLLAGGIYQNRAMLENTIDMFTARFETVEEKIDRLETELAELKAKLN